LVLPVTLDSPNLCEFGFKQDIEGGNALFVSVLFIIDIASFKFSISVLSTLSLSFMSSSISLMVSSSAKTSPRLSPKFVSCLMAGTMLGVLKNREMTKAVRKNTNKIFL